MDTTAQPARTMPKYATTASTVIGMFMAIAWPAGCKLPANYFGKLTSESNKGTGAHARHGLTGPLLKEESNAHLACTHSLLGMRRNGTPPPAAPPESVCAAPGQQRVDMHATPWTQIMLHYHVR